MKSFKKELTFTTPTRRQLLNITPYVDEALKESGIKEGLLLCNAMHITSSVFINDDESGLHHDFEVFLERLAPEKPYDQYRHNTYEYSARSEERSAGMGCGFGWSMTDGRLDFGPWEQIFYGEFDGKRPKRVLIKIIGL